jgi:hypothetical protein
LGGTARAGDRLGIQVSWTEALSLEGKASRVAAILAGLVPAALSFLAAGVLCAYLTEYGAARFALAAAAAAGLGISAAAYVIVSRFCHTRRRALLALALVALLLLVPLASTVYPGRVTYARFGLTVYGLIPVPNFDITVGPRGGLWFRDKSHLVSYDEVQRLVSPGVEALVIGIGWDSAVRVDPAVRAMEGLEVQILPTPQAFELFNRYRAQGRKVVLLAHSTC